MCRFSVNTRRLLVKSITTWVVITGLFIFSIVCFWAGICIINSSFGQLESIELLADLKSVESIIDSVRDAFGGIAGALSGSKVPRSNQQLILGIVIILIGGGMFVSTSIIEIRRIVGGSNYS